MNAKTLFSENNIHLAFEISLAFKGIFAVGEMIAGVAAYFVTKEFLVNIVDFVTKVELTEDPHDFIANSLLHAAQGLSLSAQHFTAFYLFSHGVVKFWLILGLWRRKMWYYPAAMGVFGLFIVYQVYLYFFTHKTSLLLLTILDLFVIALTWLEYQHLHRGISRVSQ
ncbi:DUF2127 domain-containing protein [Fundidesulfovibrio butyratiphilus]